LPAAAEFARLARLTVAGLANRIGFSYDEVEDLRIAVGEACSLLMSGERSGSLELVFRIQPSQLEIVVTGTVDPRAAAADGLSRQILEAVVDVFDLGPDRVRLVKHR
jgi:anti-sigma regulatory factor (Ser/Thr protein kinase)